MKPSTHPRTNRARTALLSALTLVLCLTVAPAAQAYVTPGQAQSAAAAGAGWFQDEQESSGALLGDWGMTAFAAADVNAADVRAGLAGPSAQDFYVDDWAANGPGGAATDAERAVLAGSAGGIQTSRVAVDTNLVSEIAALYDGTQIGSTGLVNDDIFGVLALDQVDAPQPLLERVAAFVRSKQLASGGWSYSTSPSAPTDTDLTAAAAGALCASGADPATDPDIAEAFAYLHSVQDNATGGFASPPFFPVNTDSTGWAASGLIQCGIDPQSADWTTAAGKTPLDYLLTMQKADGRFCWIDTTDCSGSAAYATWDAVRPLGGDAFSGAAPDRENPADPAIRPAPSVAAGTDVPVTLVIDHGDAADDVRMCQVDVPAGTLVDGVLDAAQASSAPAGCVSSSATTTDSGAVSVSELNGVTPVDGGEWRIRVDGSPAAGSSSEPVGLGDLVFLQLQGASTTTPPPPVVPPTVPPAEAKRVGLGERVKATNGGAVVVPVSCPAEGEACVGTLTLGLQKAGKRVRGGRASYALGAGESRKVTVQPSRRLRRELRKRKHVRVVLTAATRAEDGAVGISERRVRIAGKKR